MYMGFSILLIITTLLEYTKMIISNMENVHNISMIPLAIHSIWNLLSILVHLIIGY